MGEEDGSLCCLRTGGRFLQFKGTRVLFGQPAGLSLVDKESHAHPCTILRAAEVFLDEKQWLACWYKIEYRGVKKSAGRL